MKGKRYTKLDNASWTVCLMYVNSWEEDDMKFVFDQRLRY